MFAKLTYLGDIAITLPIALACAIWLAISHRRMALLWLVSLAAGMALVGATKIVFAVWQREIDPIGFRMISGHAMLSTAVWTVAVTLLCWGRRHGTILCVIVGLSIGAATGAAHILDHSHTVVEGVIGWLVGATVAMSFLHQCRRAGIMLVRPKMAGAALLIVSSLTYGRTTPMESLINEYSPVLISHVLTELSSLFRA
jgi:hypothetical protein